MSLKIKTTLASLSVLVFAFGGFVPAWAQSNESSEDSDEATTQIMQQARGRLSEQQLQELEQRLKKRKEAMKLRLSNSDKVRLQNRCQAAQGALSSVQGRIQGIQTSRTQVYGNLTQRLTDLSAKLALNGVDTTELNQAIAELETQVEAFNTALTNYIQAVTDLALMQCADDAEGFKASLEQARQLQQELRQAGLAIKALMQDKIKPLLVEIREQLVDTADDDTEGGNE